MQVGLSRAHTRPYAAVSTLQRKCLVSVALHVCPAHRFGRSLHQTIVPERLSLRSTDVIARLALSPNPHCCPSTDEHQQRIRALCSKATAPRYDWKDDDNRNPQRDIPCAWIRAHRQGGRSQLFELTATALLTPHRPTRRWLCISSRSFPSSRMPVCARRLLQYARLALLPG